MNIKHILENSSAVDLLLENLDERAREVNGYEYGLPLYDESQKAYLREAVYQWLSKLNTEEAAANPA